MIASRVGASGKNWVSYDSLIRLVENLSASVRPTTDLLECLGRLFIGDRVWQQSSREEISHWSAIASLDMNMHRVASALACYSFYVLIGFKIKSV